MGCEANGEVGKLAFRKVYFTLKNGHKKRPLVLPAFEQCCVWISKLKV